MPPAQSAWKPSRIRNQWFRHKQSSILSLRLPWRRYALCLATIVLLAWFLPRRMSMKSPEVWADPLDHPVADAFVHQSSQHVKGQEKQSPKVSPRARLTHRFEPTRPRPRAAIISLVRNEELDGILQSMRQLEYHWNKRYLYPWIFFSEQPFNDEFKAATANATAAETIYHLIPRDHWSVPEWVDLNRYMDSLDYLSAISVGKGYMLSYRNMCRWNSGFFYKHPALQDYDYYWRVEPDVHFLCDIPYDPFAFMADNKLVYGFNMNILDDARSFASLWRKTIDFAKANPQLVHTDADLAWLIDTTEYNNCQFFSNFEIGDLNFFRGAPNQAYFEYLDRSGGFYYERFGDAPIHTLSVALFAPKRSVHFFNDIGYQHDIARHCPLQGVMAGQCHCEPTGLDENFYKLVPMESPQRKPKDTCIRQWLGGQWLATKPGWNQDAERALGGDGYGGYVWTGMET